MLSVHCPSCGGTNIFDEKKQIPTYCAFCGAHFPDMTTFVQESLKLGLDKQHHSMEMEKADKEIKKEQIKAKSDHRENLLTFFICSVAFIIIIIMIIRMYQIDHL